MGQAHITCRVLKPEMMSKRTRYSNGPVRRVHAPIQCMRAHACAHIRTANPTAAMDMSARAERSAIAWLSFWIWSGDNSSSSEVAVSAGLAGLLWLARGCACRIIHELSMHKVVRQRRTYWNATDLLLFRAHGRALRVRGCVLLSVAALGFCIPRQSCLRSSKRDLVVKAEWACYFG
jgi:hypothetical protein